MIVLWLLWEAGFLWQWVRGARALYPTLTGSPGSCLFRSCFDVRTLAPAAFWPGVVAVAALTAARAAATGVLLPPGVTFTRLLMPGYAHDRCAERVANLEAALGYCPRCSAPAGEQTPGCPGWPDRPATAMWRQGPGSRPVGVPLPTAPDEAEMRRLVTEIVALREAISNVTAQGDESAAAALTAALRVRHEALTTALRGRRERLVQQRGGRL